MRFARSATVHVLQAILEGAIVASLVVVLIAGTAFAAKGGNGPNKGGGGTGGTASGSIVMPNGVFGTKDVGSVYPGNGYWVYFTCAQNGTTVFNSYVQSYGNTVSVQLGPTYSWTSGGASCSATEYYFDNRGTYHSVAGTTFTVSP